MDQSTTSDNIIQGELYPVSHLVSPFFILGCITFSTLIVGFLVYRWTMNFDTTDSEIKIEYLTPKKITELDASSAARANVGMTIKNFRDFDILHNHFEFDCMLWFEFDPTIISVNSVSDFSFIRGEIIYKSNPISYAQKGRLFLVFNDVRVKFTNPMNYRYFPVDDHRLSIGLINNASLISELHYVTRNDNFIISEDMVYSGWYKFGQRAQTGYVTTNFRDREIMQPITLFTIDYGRGGSTRNPFIIILPMLLLFFVALFLFAAKKIDSRLSIPIQSFVGLVAFRFVLEALSPAVGYFMYVDYLFVLFLALIFMLILTGAVSYVFSKNLNKLIIVVMNLILIGTFWYLL